MDRGLKFSEKRSDQKIRNPAQHDADGGFGLGGEFVIYQVVGAQLVDEIVVEIAEAEFDEGGAEVEEIFAEFI